MFNIRPTRTEVLAPSDTRPPVFDGKRQGRGEDVNSRQGPLSEEGPTK